MKHYTLPKFPESRKSKADWKYWFHVFIYALIGSILVLIVMMEMGVARARAQDMTYTGVIKEGEVITKTSFCNS